MSLEITHRCIAQCLMCNIWKIPAHVPDLSLQSGSTSSLQTLLGDLRELDITGGEPFLRSDLPDLMAAVCERTRHHLKRLKTIAITTNGLLTDRVLHATRRITEILKDHPLDLVLVCAMDGIGKIHDRIRNVKDAWTRVDATLQGLIDMRARFPRLIIGLKTTVLPMNVDQLGPISQYADSHGLFTIISPCIITAGRYLNLEKAEEMSSTRDQKEQLKAFYRSDTFAWSFHAERLVEYLETGALKRPCTCGFNYLFVRSNGQVLLCPLVPLSPGNIKEKGLDEILRSPESNAIRRKRGQVPGVQPMHGAWP